jgi:DNA-binding PadR family transcriptional regulator
VKTDKKPTLINDTMGAILGHLNRTPMSGGRLCTELATFQNFWSSTRSQVYRELASAGLKGLAKPGKPGPRKVVIYKITAKGRTAYKRWLASQGKVLLRDGVTLRRELAELESSAT